MEGHPQAQAATAAHGASRPHVEHPPYILVAFWLFVVTAIEVAVPTLIPTHAPALSTAIVPALFVLALIKGLGIALYYMHLKFDSRLFASLFLWGVVLAASLIIVFLGLFAYAHQPL